jgi:hypothetical protein
MVIILMVIALLFIASLCIALFYPVGPKVYLIPAPWPGMLPSITPIRIHQQIAIDITKYADLSMALYIHGKLAT